MKTGIVVFAHGSRVESANEGVRAAARDLARAGGFEHVVAAFLELGAPDMEGAVTELAEKGVERVVVVPYFLTVGLHLERDVRRLADEISRKFKGIEVVVAAPMEGHPGLVGVLLDRISASLT